MFEIYWSPNLRSSCQARGDIRSADVLLLSHHTVWGIVYCGYFYLFLCTVTDFSAAEKDRGVKFCMRDGLLFGQVFSPFAEHWLAANHGGGITSRMGSRIGSRIPNCTEAGV